MSTSYSLYGSLKVRRSPQASDAICELSVAIDDADMIEIDYTNHDHIGVDIRVDAHMGWGRVSAIDEAIKAVEPFLLEPGRLAFDCGEGPGVDYYGTPEQKALARSTDARAGIMEALPNLTIDDARFVLESAAIHLALCFQKASPTAAMETAA